MSEGVTTVGSIIGRLQIDSSNWDAELDRAEARARELGTANPRLHIDSNATEATAALETVAVEVEKIGASRPAVRVDSNAAAAVIALEAVDAEARKIGETSPRITVDTAPAVTASTALAAAMARLDAAERSAANAASTAYVAQLRLSDLQEKGAASALQLAVAEEAVARADRNAEAAEAKQIALTEALNAARKDAAGSAVEDAAATEADTAAKKSNTSAGNSQVSMMMGLVAAAPAMVAALAPIGGAAVGLGSAFSLMAVSGVLAINGIKQAMQVGDTVGNAYSAGIVQLKGNLDNLSGTAANGMLAGFNQVIGDINQDMPFLNQTVGTFSSMLGQMGGVLVNGVLNGLEQMNPLLQEGGIQLSHFVGWLAGMTSTNGFTEFVTYAVDNLPSVMTLIESLVTTAGHIIAAFAPLGPAVIGALTGISDALSSMPLPVLAGLVTSATSMGIAFQFAGSKAISGGIIAVAEAIGLTGVMANLAVPVVGILLAAVAGLAVGFASSAASTQSVTQATQDYTQSLKDDNNTLGEHVRLQAAKALADDGAFQAAQKLGISQKTLTDDILGVGDAQKEVADKIAYAQRIIDAHSSSLRSDGTAMNDSAKEADGLQGAIEKVNSSVGAQVTALDRGRQANQDVSAAMSNQQLAAQSLAGQYGATVAGIQSAQQAEQQTADQLAQTTVNMQLQNDAAGLLKAALDGLNGKSLSAAQAQNAFDSSLANMGDHMNATGKQITFTTTSIGDMSAASVSLRGQLNGQVAALQQTVEANGGLANSTGAAREQMATMRQQIIDNAVAHGVNRDAVTAYIDKILAIPATVPPTKLDVDSAAAVAKLQEVQTLLAGIQSKHIQVTTDYISNGQDTGIPNTTNAPWNPGIVKYHEAGGIVSYLASGGMPFPGGPRGTDTVPTWLTPGEFVVNRDATARNRPALEAMNSGGTLTGAAQPSGPVTINLILDGQIIDTRIVSLAGVAANAAITAADRDSARRRVGV